MLNKHPALHLLLKNKELFIALYFLLFILGLTIGISSKFYNEFRVLEVILLLGLAFYSLIYKQCYVSRLEILFLTYIAVASLFWQHYEFIVLDLLLAYLLYKCFFILEYNEQLTRLIVIASLLIFPLLPISVIDYINTGAYYPIWHPMPWNIRIYDSYLLIVSIWAVWFYSTQIKYRNIYLIFLLLAFFTILLNASRSVTLAYTVFIVIIVTYNRTVRWQLLSTYVASWFTYLSISYLASIHMVNASVSGLQIARVTTSLRYDLWMNALECWLQSPFVGCGFYQFGRYEHLAAHPHNLLLQILTETGLIGFGFLLAIFVTILKNIPWQIKKSYFVLASLLAIGIDTSLSGTHIYPITQIAILWLMVFLLKNPAFEHATYFNRILPCRSRLNRFTAIAIYCILLSIFGYVFITTTVLLDNNIPETPPRFWEYGYKI